MRVYYFNGHKDKFYNIKLRKEENVDFAKYTFINPNFNEYKGWLKLFFKELPDKEFEKLLQYKEYSVLVYKEKRPKGRVLAFVAKYGRPNLNNVVEYDKGDIQFLKNREIYRLLRRSNEIRGWAP